jgi:predicted transcriptional regulator
MSEDVTNNSRKLLELLSKIADSTNEYAELANELKQLLNETVFESKPKDVDIPSPVVVSVSTNRPYREVRFSPLRCEENAELKLVGVSIHFHRHSPHLVLRVKELAGYDRSKTLYLADINLEDLLEVACNVTPEEMDRLAEGVANSVKALEEDIRKLKGLLTYARLVG